MYQNESMPNAIAAEHEEEVNIAALASCAITTEEAANAIVDALTKKLVKGLSVAQEDVQPKAPVHVAEQDPLIPVEILYRFIKILGTGCTVLEILGNAGIVEDWAGKH